MKSILSAITLRPLTRNGNWVQVKSGLYMKKEPLLSGHTRLTLFISSSNNNKNDST